MNFFVLSFEPYVKTIRDDTAIPYKKDLPLIARIFTNSSRASRRIRVNS